jgi:hypothetical protein
MTLSVQHQLKLLRDILDEHQSQGTGSVSEHQQLMRCVQSILSKDNTFIDETFAWQLQEIYNYGQKGKNTGNQSEHITGHQDAISAWVHAISNNALK